ncbi:hypothetical protein GCM10010140_66520 [Streptosporangium pseudovulgare]|uniref:Uncharacterized protein n=1 Tax=Streptosporangium pseudovulgare TaxID=35765 RepID=A0ABQ2RHW9_9ACTN|nr:hypothetical protein GCM10010140_66520 [Streptosporangium pseudovulgare]
MYCDHVLVKYELWDGEPPAMDWDESWAGAVHLPLGKDPRDQLPLRRTGLLRRVRAGPPGRRWQFRVHRKLPGHEDFTVDIVGFSLFKVQFRPSAEAPALF